ncbi:MAG TPA: NAD-dependent epimerase/dehydratase family protein [Candidatus Deferrimicrobium sp.]|nr:NAD-dependent epimerase/dehydratase family protein [Candidatus Deferrimicrobium sp.]
MAAEITCEKILITGASGSLGKQLIFELHRRGVSPVAHVRDSSDTTYMDSLGLEKRTADLRNPAQLTQLVHGIECIIHTAAWVNFRQDRLTQFTGINTFGAVNLFKAAQDAGVRRFVQVSSVAAVGALPRNSPRRNSESRIEVADENLPFNLRHLRIPYILTKRAAEEELLQAAQDRATELIIVNPSIVVAPSRTGDDRGKARHRLNRFLIPDLPNRVNLVDIRDVAPGILSALCKGRHGERYILGGDNISARDLALIACTILGRTPHLLRIPKRFFYFAARCSEKWTRILGRGKVSFYPDLVRMLDYDWAYSSAKARQELGYQTRSIHNTMNDLLNNRLVGTYAKPD